MIMNKYKMIGALFIVLGVLVIIGASYVIMSYASGLISAIVDFVTTTDFAKLQQCGVSPPAEFQKLKNEAATVILPFLYLGIPIILIVLSVLMFLGGFYYHRGRHEDDARRTEELERHLLRKAVKKIETEKEFVTAPSDIVEENVGEDIEIGEVPEEEPEEESGSKKSKKK